MLQLTNPVFPPRLWVLKAQMQPFDEHFEVVVVGAGHAGCEAAMAAARMD